MIYLRKFIDMTSEWFCKRQIVIVFLVRLLSTHNNWQLLTSKLQQVQVRIPPLYPCYQGWIVCAHNKREKKKKYRWYLDDRWNPKCSSKRAVNVYNARSKDAVRPCEWGWDEREDWWRMNKSLQGSCSRATRTWGRFQVRPWSVNIVIAKAPSRSLRPQGHESSSIVI